MAFGATHQQTTHNWRGFRRDKRAQHTLYKWAIFALLLLTTVMLVPNAAHARKYAAFVMEADTGRVLFSRYADSKRYPASLTKMMTLYMVFEAIDRGKLKWNQKLRVSKRAAGQPPSKLGLKRGQTIRVKDAAMALITKSANDAATVLAEAIGGTEWEFAQMMTKKARSLGMKKTSFRNASGLPNRRQLSTARDMAKLGLALQEKFPHHYNLFNTTRFTYKGRTYKNHNKLLSTLKGTNGIKTGYIRASGFNLVSSVTRNGKTLIGVVFGGRTGRSRDAHMVKIINQSFRKAGPPVLLAKNLPLPIPRPNTDKPEMDGTGTFIQAAQVARPGVAPVKRPATSSPNVAQSPQVQKPVAQKPVARTTVAAVDPSAGISSVGNTQGIWGIQVGAFKNRNSAESQIAQALKKLPVRLSSQAKELLESVDDGAKRLYRARVAGYGKTDAVRACALLMAQKVRCVTIPPERLSLTDIKSNG